MATNYGSLHENNYGVPVNFRRCADETTGFALAAVVALSSAVFADSMRWALRSFAKVLGGHEGALAAAATLAPYQRAIVVLVAVAAASFINRRYVFPHICNVGVSAIRRSMDDRTMDDRTMDDRSVDDRSVDDRSVDDSVVDGSTVATASGASFGGFGAKVEPIRANHRATLLRSFATFVAVGGFTSIGRESAILDAGAVLGDAAGSRFSRDRLALVSAGIAAAFSAAYFAPVAAILFVFEHFWHDTHASKRSNPVQAGVKGRIGEALGSIGEALKSIKARAAIYALVGSYFGHLVSVDLFHEGAVLPTTGASLRATSLWGVAVVVPVVMTARVFRISRDLAKKSADESSQHNRFSRGEVLAALSVAGVFAFTPNVAGNGSDALRLALASPIWKVALTVVVCKAMATVAAMRLGVPGGAFFPTMAVGGGCALLVALCLKGFGLWFPRYRAS